MPKPTLEIALLALTSEPSGLDFSEKKVIWPETNSGEAPTWGDLESKLTELQADYDSKQYQRDRKLEYPTIEELVVALYDEEDKQAIIEKRNAVKAKYPKPE